MSTVEIQSAKSTVDTPEQMLGQCAETLVTRLHLACVDAPKVDWQPAPVWRKDFVFYRLRTWTVCDVDDLSDFFGTKMQALLTMVHALGRAFCYGLESDGKGPVSLVLGISHGVEDDTEGENIRTLLEGALPGVRLEHCKEEVFGSDALGRLEAGWLGGTPVAKVDGAFRHRDLAALMRCLNGRRYAILVACKPLPMEDLQTLFQETLNVRDVAFACSKQTLSMQRGDAETWGKSFTHSETKGVSRSKTTGWSVGASGSPIGGVIGGAVGGPIGVGVGLLFSLFASKTSNTTTGESSSKTDSQTFSLSQTVSETAGVSMEARNGLAMELAELADATLSRLKAGRGIGMWRTCVTFSADTPATRDLIKGTLHGLFASDSPTALPPFGDALPAPRGAAAVVPKGFFEAGTDTPCTSLLTSEELCALCTVPAENTVGFEVRRERLYALSHAQEPNDHTIGRVCEYNRPLEHAYFGLSKDDLNKHTLVCGITGCGKTNTVKRLLAAAEVPFLVIEPAKKEYRNLKDVKVYTFGRPELLSPRINPFYILPGISPQQHIDALKELFSAAFGFYGPMPYIFERCLNAIYVKKGWDLELGLHRDYLSLYGVDYSAENQEKFVAQKVYPFLCPTMEDLKEEIASYINELTYEGEVKGNIEGALKARIDSLCVGAKGYLFNTSETLNFREDVLMRKTVFELEGLADDADKAFALGLVVILVNECRQVEKELDNKEELHLLVIEEAHRLLTATTTESGELLGNPKGKAVEYFTDMIAEMRAYGQGVIIAEQIPCKLAPEVIKNTSTKITHRLVAKDDQEALANAMGIRPEDAIYLGTLRVGHALCHKEGMAQPVSVKIDCADVEVRRLDGALLTDDRKQANLCAIGKARLLTKYAEPLRKLAGKTFVSLMVLNDSDTDRKALTIGFDRECRAFEQEVGDDAPLQGIRGETRRDRVREALFETMVERLLTAPFRGTGYPLPSDEFLKALQTFLKEGDTCDVAKHLREFYLVEDLVGQAALIVRTDLGETPPLGRWAHRVDEWLVAPERSDRLVELVRKLYGKE